MKKHKRITMSDILYNKMLKETKGGHPDPVGANGALGYVPKRKRGDYTPIITVILLFFLFGCKTPVATEKTVQVDSIRTEEAISYSKDSLIQQMLSSLTIDYDYILIEWSKPDSIGKQYKDKEHHIKASVKADQETNTSQVKNEQSYRRDSANVSSNVSEKSTPVKTLSWWDKLKLKVGNTALIVLFLIGISYIVYWLIRRKK